MFLFMPIGMLLLFIGMQCMQYAQSIPFLGYFLAAVVAFGAIGTDVMFFAGGGLFPVCAIASNVKGFGFDGTVLSCLNRNLHLRVLLICTMLLGVNPAYV